MELPQIVSEEEWQRSHEALLEKEKEATRAGDALAAERRRQPMMELSGEYEFDGPEGRRTLVDLFDGRRQLIVYHFTSFALVSRASQPEIEKYKQRMGWAVPWYTVVGEGFQEACGTTEYFALDVFLRDGDRVFLTYATTSRGVEALGSVWTFLDLTPLGRQEEWEDTPPGRPQGPPYKWWRRHDEYDSPAA
jgi:predicted dithiol-disulfide oxidoreductase (DUF899 family)